ncbi:MAG: urea ABC transporter permease subunit UrtB [Chthoniobacteraceae bacterium]
MHRILILLAALICITARAETPREVIAKAAVLDDSEAQAKLVQTLADSGSPDVGQLLTLWKEGGIFLLSGPTDTKIAITLGPDKDAGGNQAVFRFETGAPVLDEAGKPLRALASDLNTAETDSLLRTAMKSVMDLAQLSSADVKQRLRSVETLGMEQNPERLPVLLSRQQKETDSQVKRAIREAIALTEIKDEDPAKQIAACRELGAIGSIPSQDILKQVVKDGVPEVQVAATAALKEIASHVRTVDTVGTLFRGLSAGSILLVVAIGLAITFGLMGVINMAHGEMIAIGAYTTYIVQCVFGPGLEVSPFGFHINLPGMNATGWHYDCYFIVAIPLSFLTAALAGLALERGIIRFLYSRPLESLLATWGVSLVLQQLFRLTFGANNVQVSAPSWLSGNWTVNDILFPWNRVFVVVFAIAIVIGVNLLLKKTPLGLLIRAVMQNRNMAACMGVRTERVNMLTFALGSGLAGLAGAFISQIGNVGPGLGQLYIVDSFMTVVVGGVGNLFGTVFSSLGIGMADQGLQQILGNPVLGKILVLAGIILFLQWRPAGIFVSKSRSLES